MGFGGVNSLRYRKTVLTKIAQIHKKSFNYAPNIEQYIDSVEPIIDLYWKYYEDCDLDSTIRSKERDNFYNDVDKIIIENFTTWANTVLTINSADITMVYIVIHNQPLNHEILISKLEIFVDNWVLVNKGPVIDLAIVSLDRQSVHTKIVEENTDKGISILEAMKIPKGQNTLKEIRESFENFAKSSDLEKVMYDISDWGNRTSVVRKNENLYRKVLRGLWAKINSYEDAELRSQLINRLWEECLDSVEMCADGHVGRLVNVLCGFDDNFISKMSSKEYFQNNIALIAANDLAPLEMKIKHAKKLMDEVSMPEEERSVWLEAL